MNQRDHYRKNQKHNWINERRIKWENNERVCCIERQPYSYLTDNMDENKKAKGTNKVFRKTMEL